MIEAFNLRKKFGDIEALKSVSFTVRAGEIYGLLGPNGAGKSTTIGVLCGLVVPDSGQASLDGIDIARRPVEARRVLGVVPQEVALYTEFSARDNLSFFGRLSGLGGARLSAAVEQDIARVGLADRAREPIERFSGGMLRRLNIAAGLLHGPKAVLMDEPTVGLDLPVPREHSRTGPVDRGRRGGGGVHDRTISTRPSGCATASASSIAGRSWLRAPCRSSETRQEPREIIALRGTFATEVVTREMQRHPEFEVLKVTDSELLLTVQRAEQHVAALLAAASSLGSVREVAIRQPSLESLFIKLTGRELRE